MLRGTPSSGTPPRAARDSLKPLLLHCWADPDPLLHVFSYLLLSVGDVVKTYRRGALKHRSALLHELSYRMIASNPNESFTASLDLYGFSVLCQTVQSEELFLKTLEHLRGFVLACRSPLVPSPPEPRIQIPRDPQTGRLTDDISYYTAQLERIAVLHKKKAKHRKGARRKRRRLMDLSHPVDPGIEDDATLFGPERIRVSDIPTFWRFKREEVLKGPCFDPRLWGVRPRPFRYLRSLVVSFKITDPLLSVLATECFELPSANPTRFSYLRDLSLENCGGLKTFEGLEGLLTWMPTVPPSGSAVRIRTLGLSHILRRDEVRFGSLVTVLRSTLPSTSTGDLTIPTTITHLQTLRFRSVDFSIEGWNEVFRSGRLRMVIFNECWNLNYVLESLCTCVTDTLIIRNSYPLHSSWQDDDAGKEFYRRLAMILQGGRSPDGDRDGVPGGLRALRLLHVDADALTDRFFRTLYESGLRSNTSLEELLLEGRSSLSQRSVGIMKDLLNTHLRLRRVTFFTKDTYLRTEESRCIGELVSCVDPSRHERVRIVPSFAGVNKDEFRKKYLMALRLRMLNRDFYAKAAGSSPPPRQPRITHVQAKVAKIREETGASGDVAHDMLMRCSGDLVIAVDATKHLLEHQRRSRESGGSVGPREPIEGEYTPEMDMALLELDERVPRPEEEPRLQFLEEKLTSWPSLHDVNR